MDEMTMDIEQNETNSRTKWNFHQMKQQQMSNKMELLSNEIQSEGQPNVRQGRLNVEQRSTGCWTKVDHMSDKSQLDVGQKSARC
jgi:hypothetical protein